MLNTRYYLSGNSIVFPRRGFVFHRSFGENYWNYSKISARRKLKQWYTKGQQNDILHYLQEQKYLI